MNATQRARRLALLTVQHFSSLLEVTGRWGYILQEGSPEANRDSLLCAYFDDAWEHAEQVTSPLTVRLTYFKHYAQQ